MSRIPQKRYCVLSASFKGLMMLINPTVDDANLDHLLQVVSDEFFHCKVMFPFVVINASGRYFEAMKTYPFLSNFHPVISAFVSGSCVQQFLL